MTDSRWKTAEETYGCALLAGGEGKRLGGVNKAQLLVPERPPGSDSAEVLQEKEPAETLLARTARILSGTGLPCYLSVAAYEMAAPEGWTTVDDRDYLTGLLPDSSGFAGPMGGICACLRKAREDGLDGLFFVPCDAPGFEVDVIEKMLPHLQNDMAGQGNAAGQGTKPCDAPPDIVVWQTPDGCDQMTFAYYAVGCLPAIEKQLAEGRYRLRGLLEEGIRFVRLLTKEEGLPEERFRNLNTLEDID